MDVEPDQLLLQRTLNRLHFGGPAKTAEPAKPVEPVAAPRGAHLPSLDINPKTPDPVATPSFLAAGATGPSAPDPVRASQPAVVAASTPGLTFAFGPASPQVTTSPAQAIPLAAGDGQLACPELTLARAGVPSFEAHLTGPFSPPPNPPQLGSSTNVPVARPIAPSTSASVDPATNAAILDFFAQAPAHLTKARPPVVSPAPSLPTPEPIADTSLPSVPPIVAEAIRVAHTQTPTAEVVKEKPESNKKELSERTQNIRRRSFSHKEPSDTSTETKLKIGVLALTPQAVFTGGICIFAAGILLMCFVSVLGGVCSAFGGSRSSEAPGGIAPVPRGPAEAPTVDMAGNWKLRFLTSSGQPVDGQMSISQRGNEFEGIGVDQNGSFGMSGRLNDRKIFFAKQYMQGGQPVGKSISYEGEINYVSDKPYKAGQPSYAHAFGIWEVTKRSGYGWRGQIVTLRGKWEAALVQRAAFATTGASHSTTIASPSANAAATGPGILPAQGDFKGWANFWLKIVGVLVLLAAGIVYASLILFGPGGKINIWAKKKYIPSQYASQHWKRVREWGRTLKPGGLPMGRRVDWWWGQFYRARDLNMPADVRAANPHMLILGAGAKGKSRLLANMISHDIIANDRAVVVIDSKGLLVDSLVTWIAAHPKGQEIAERILVIDPLRGGNSPAFNPLEFPEDGDLQNAASALVYGFKAVYTEPPGSQSQWNQQTANILRNAAMLLMANGKTLTDLPLLLSENDFRDVLLEKVERMKNDRAEYTALVEAWAQYKRLARTDQWINWVEPILNRVQPMLGNPRIRPILTRPKGDLNLKEVLSERKILFVKVPKGQNLLGSLVVTGLQQAAQSYSLQGLRKHTCALYLDEFDNFIEKETFDHITSETEKFQIGLVGAAKTLQALPEDFRNHLVINTGTLCCFALAKKDGDLLGPQMFRVDGRKIKHQTLQNIFNKVNTQPLFEFVSDEEKLNIDRVVAQEDRTYFCYRVGDVAAVFNLKAPDFNDIDDKHINWTLVDQIYAVH
jgi:hypothetical protein